MLSTRDYNILDCLAEDAGFTTRQVALKAWTSHDRRGSANCRLALLWLQREGYVGTLDNQKPVCWVRTRQGSVELKRAVENYDYVPYRPDAA